MKNISTILSALSLALMAVLFVLFFNHTHEIQRISVATQKQVNSNFRIAYFDIDSLEAHYNYFKDILGQVKEKENAMNAELAGMEKTYQKKIAEWQKKGTTMTQAESDQAQQEYAMMQQNYQARKQTLQEELFKHNEDLKSDIRKKIEAFLDEYNKMKNYSFIFAYESNSFMYSKDTAYDITQDLINGLNANYKKSK
ncbi:MAG TPA: OmpH family outer membrane protein [Puia sp.]|nr:OmpH family outer membrane protein [Puia sp.]